MGCRPRLTDLGGCSLPAAWVAGATHLVNAIRPAERSAGRACGPIIDTQGYRALRATLIFGQPRGMVEFVEFALLASDVPSGPFTASDGLAGSIVNDRGGISVAVWQLGPNVRKRFVRVAVDLHGTGRVVYGVFLELIPVRSDAAR